MFSVSPAILSVLINLPRDRFSIPEEAALRSAKGQGCQPDDGVSAFFDGAGRTGTTHIGPHPAGAYGVDQDACSLQLTGQDASVHIQHDFGDAVSRVVGAESG